MSAPPPLSSEVTRSEILPGRESHIHQKGNGAAESPVTCDRESLAGAVSQRGCVYCGARVVLNPIADAIHLVHGPIGCASYTWDIRGSLSSGPQTFRNSFSTDLREKDIIFGGEAKLYRAINELAEKFKPPAIFVYATCVVGVIGDDLRAVCKKASAKTGVRVIPVLSEGFKGNKSAGYRAACEALLELIGTDQSLTDSESPSSADSPFRINVLGEFNVAGGLWAIKRYLDKMGVTMVASITGDGRVDRIAGSNRALLNLVQCAGSLTYLAKKMDERYQIPFLRVSFFGLEDVRNTLTGVARFFDSPLLMRRAYRIINRELARVEPELKFFRTTLAGRRAAVYTGGAFRALSLIKTFHDLGMKVVLVGTQTGKKEEYEEIKSALPDGAVIIDDANPLELTAYMRQTGAEILVGGAKERPLAYKLGISFCDYNHERKKHFEGFDGLLNFAREVHATLNSPVWGYLPPDKYPRNRGEAR